MLYAIGTKVQFKYSPDRGIVTQFLDNGMVQVLVEGTDIQIPVFPEDLIPAEQFYDDSATKAKVVPGKKEKIILPPARNPVASQYAILKSKGIQLAFKAVLHPDATPEKYIIFLLNDTALQVLFSIKLFIQKEQIFAEHGKLKSVSAQEVGEIFYDELNDSPVFEIECTRITTDGTGAREQKSLRIKPKQFFKNLQTAPILNEQVHLYTLFDKLSADRKDPRDENLKQYTQRQTKPRVQPQFSKGSPKNPAGQLAEFQTELDLHIENLTDKPGSLKKSEILHLQLKHFDAYIDRAVRLGVDRVFIIHGVGEGKLRNAIATRLIQQPYVKSFKNEFHPRYGFGATEVIFD